MEENRMSVKERVMEILNREFDIDKNTDISQTLLKVGIDSIRLMMLIVNLEEEFGFEFDDTVMLGEIETISELCAVVEEKAN